MEQDGCEGLAWGLGGVGRGELGMVWCEVGCDGTRWDAIERDGMRWDAMGCDGTGRD